MSAVGRTALLAVAASTLLAAVPAHASVHVNTPQPAIVSPDPVDWTPNVLDGRVRAIAQVGSRMVLGGTFTQVQNAGQSSTLTRNYLFAFDASTGTVDSDSAAVYVSAGSKVKNKGTKGKVEDRTWRMRFDMTKVGDRWLVSQLEFVG